MNGKDEGGGEMREEGSDLMMLWNRAGSSPNGLIVLWERGEEEGVEGVEEEEEGLDEGVDLELALCCFGIRGLLLLAFGLASPLLENY